MIPYLTSEKLQKLPGIIHGFTTRCGGVSQGTFDSLNINFNKGDPDPNVIENRRRIAQTFGGSLEDLSTTKQVHGTGVVIVTKPLTHPLPEADAMVTRCSEIILGISTADCVPVLFADPESNVIGAAHAGWKGATSGILQNTITAMEEIGAKREKIIAALGPCIWQSSYEVDQNFYDRLITDAELFIPSHRFHHWLFDLPGYVEKVLRSQGIAAIDSSPADTLTNPDLFFSFRRRTLLNEPPIGGQLSIIKLSRTEC
ncbi:MAG TPA: peptidoglycan editing factor PgeF [Candidatus Nitrosotenuis sp.]|jgi:YfiH family protein|nr:peptidoglycan editing factor PgeF [Candidatus Nitrosotenuis sp.]